MWKIIAQDGDAYSDKPIDTREQAQAVFNTLPKFVQESSMIAYRSGNTWVDRVLTEGLTKNDLEGILLPRLSVDEYVPSDPNTDNVVMAFFIKGVPEAVLPYKNYCEHCNGVVNVDYSDSDTIPNASVVYVEMDRESISLGDVQQLLKGAGRLGNFQVDDFTMTFPHTDDKFPFSINTLQMYFRSRTREKNQLAQRKAEKIANQENQKVIDRLQSSDTPEDNPQNRTQDDTQNTPTKMKEPKNVPDVRQG